MTGVCLKFGQQGFDKLRLFSKMVMKVAGTDINFISDLIRRGIRLAVFVKQQQTVDENTSSSFQ